MTVRGRGGSATSALTVSKCENFDFFSLISSHAPGLKAMFEKYDREVDDDDEQQNVLQQCW